jgi:hypothetical protein
VFSAGGSAGALAQDERLFGLLSPASAVAGQGRFIATNAGAATAGGLTQATLLAVVGPFTSVAFGALYAVAGAARLFAAVRTEVTPGRRVAPSGRGAESPERLGRRALDIASPEPA